MRHGAVVEQGPVDDIFYAPKHPYTQMLLAAMPRLDAPQPTPTVPGDTLLDVRDLKVSFPIAQGLFQQAQTIAGGGRRELSPASGRDAGGGGRIRLRQIHPRPRRAAAFARQGAARWCGWAATSATKHGKKSGRAQGFPDRVPGPAGQPRPAPAGGRLHRRAAARRWYPACRATKSRAKCAA